MVFNRVTLFNHALTVYSYLDNNETLRLKRGDVCVQRGTIHGWKNPTDKPTRIYFVLIGKLFLSPASHFRSVCSSGLTKLLIMYPAAAEPVLINGKPFDKTGFSDEGVTTGGK